MSLNYRVIIIDLPSPESVVLNEDDSYTIFINARMSVEMQQKKFLHAMRHISNDDFYSSLSADQVEMDAHY